MKEEKRREEKSAPALSTGRAVDKAKRASSANRPVGQTGLWMHTNIEERERERGAGSEIVLDWLISSLIEQQQQQQQQHNARCEKERAKKVKVFRVAATFLVDVALYLPKILVNGSTSPLGISSSPL